MRNILLQQDFDIQFYLVLKSNSRFSLLKTSQLRRTRKSTATANRLLSSKTISKSISLMLQRRSHTRRRYSVSNERWRLNAIRDERSENSNNQNSFHFQNWTQTIRWISRWLMQSSSACWSTSKIEKRKYSAFSLRSIKSISRSRHCIRILNRWRSLSWLRRFWNTSKSSSYSNA